MRPIIASYALALVAPTRERGMKCIGTVSAVNGASVAPVRERGLKYLLRLFQLILSLCRSRKGAWIEIDSSEGWTRGGEVAPVRERGLKY